MTAIVVETQAYEGVKRIANKFAHDFSSVYGISPEMYSELSDDSAKDSAGRFIFVTIDNSTIYKKLQNDYHIEVYGKKESFQIIKDGADIFVIGSDKLGTIYGIFDLSEQIGVTPFVYWGDALPAIRDHFSPDQIEERTSREPSVEYRGFFINDEWLCFGNWTFEHFGGFTAEMYDHVFELLLRLKGNCLWPAMWSSSFALDGPGQLNEELADIYGITINYSHHEPCLRASEEWDIYKGTDSGDPNGYGREWNYSTNKEGLLRYWRDGIIRSSRYKNIITMGMRGERDSKMQGADSLRECIEAWKDIITSQDELIEKYADNPEKHPKLVAIYKEVEDYFFGNEETEGLAGWEGLDDKILMFCEDNYGYMRRLPQGEMQDHKGGLGMYYHLDYHGEPVSYEWINTTPLYKIWDQMSVAYNHGIKKMWMVNVGDLKGNEYPLSFFMTLAYDFDRWGATCSETCGMDCPGYEEYARYFAKSVFASEDGLTEKIANLLTEGIDLISCRRPEALSKDTYSLTHGENDLIIDKCKDILAQIKKIKSELPSEKHDPYFSMVEYPIEIGINHMLLHLYAKKNEHFAWQGKIIANHYADLMKECYEREDILKDIFAKFKDGKWKGMELAPHTGFTKWNEFGRKNPIICRVEPLPESHMLISRIDDDFVASKKYGDLERIVIDDYNYKGQKCAAVEVAVDGLNSIYCHVEADFSKTDIAKTDIAETDIAETDIAKTDMTEIERFVRFSWMKKEIKDQELLLISVNEDAIEDFHESVEARITDGDTTVIVELRRPKDYVVLDASDNGNCHVKGREMEFECLNNFDAEIEVCVEPTNSHDETNQLSFVIDVNGEKQKIDVLQPGYKAGAPTCEQWAQGVLCNERRVKVYAPARKGKNHISLTEYTDGLKIRKIIIHEKGVRSTYTGI